MALTREMQTVTNLFYLTAGICCYYCNYHYFLKVIKQNLAYSKIPLCQRAEQKMVRRTETGGYKEMARRYIFAWQALRPVAWYYVFTSSLSQQKSVTLPKEAVLPRLFLWLFWLLHPLCPLPSPATVALHKRWRRKQLTEQNIVIFTHVSFPALHCAATRLFLLAHVKGPESCKMEQSVWVGEKCLF